MKKILLMTVLIAAVLAAPFISATDDYSYAVTRYQEAHERFAVAQEDLAACRQACDAQELEYRRGAANYLSTGADLLHQHLLQLDRYAKSAGDQGSYGEVHAQIAQLDAQVNETRELAHALTGDSSRGDLAEAEAAVQESWAKVDALTQSVTWRIINGNLDVSVQRLAETRLRLQVMRDQMASQGIQSDDLDRLLLRFDQEVKEAQQAASAQERNAALQDTPNEDARQKVTQAIDTLQEIAREIRKLNGSIPQ